MRFWLNVSQTCAKKSRLSLCYETCKNSTIWTPKTHYFYFYLFLSLFDCLCFSLVCKKSINVLHLLLKITLFHLHFLSITISYLHPLFIAFHNSSSNSLFQVLISGAIKFNRIRRTRDYDNTMRDVPDLIETARMMIKAFRTGDLGKTFLDIDLLESKSRAKREKVNVLL